MTKAGPELDALVAKAVFGRTWTKYPYVVINGDRVDLGTWLAYGTPDDPGGGARAGMTPPEYSTSIAYAWKVVEKLMEIGWTVTLAPRQFEAYPEDRFKFHGCRMLKEDGTQRMYSFSDHAETAPLAICLAALEAVSVREVSGEPDGTHAKQQC